MIMRGLVDQVAILLRMGRGTYSTFQIRYDHKSQSFPSAQFRTRRLEGQVPAEYIRPDSHAGRKNVPEERSDK